MTTLQAFSSFRLNSLYPYFDKYWPHLFLSIFGFRFAFIWLSQLDLIGDESYYWDWSRLPDWCYYSKPPMIAWLIGVLTWVFGDNMPAVRLGAVTFGTAFLVFFYLTARRLFNVPTAALASLLLLITPINAISNLLMTIDAPLYGFWGATLYFLSRALFDKNHSCWIAAGIAAALAFLTKPTALALPVLLGFFLLICREHRSSLFREFPFFVLPTVLSTLPLVIWNQQHDWIMLSHNKGHFKQETSFDLFSRLAEALEFLLYQLLLFSPILLILLLLNNVRLLASYKSMSAPSLFLYVMGPLPLFAILGLSTLQKVQGNWAVPFYFTSMLLLAQQISLGSYRHWVKPAVIVGGIMVLLTYTLPFAIQPLGLAGTTLDPTHRMRQWHDLAEQLHSIRLQHDIDNNQFIIIDAHRYLVSELAFYLPDQPHIYRHAQGGLIQSQYELWPGPVEFFATDGLLVSDKPEDQVLKLFASSFNDLRFLSTLIALQGDRKERRFYVYHATGLKTWPLN